MNRYLDEEVFATRKRDELFELNFGAPNPISSLGKQEKRSVKRHTRHKSNSNCIRRHNALYGNKLNWITLQRFFFLPIHFG